MLGNAISRKFSEGRAESRINLHYSGFNLDLNWHKRLQLNPLAKALGINRGAKERLPEGRITMQQHGNYRRLFKKHEGKIKTFVLIARFIFWIAKDLLFLTTWAKTCGGSCITGNSKIIRKKFPRATALLMIELMSNSPTPAALESGFHLITGSLRAIKSLQNSEIFFRKILSNLHNLH